MTEEELRPPPPAVPAAGSIFGGGLFSSAPVYGGGIFGGPSAHSVGASHFAFGAPVAYPKPAPPPKKKEYGLDYIWVDLFEFHRMDR